MNEYSVPSLCVVRFTDQGLRQELRNPCSRPYLLHFVCEGRVNAQGIAQRHLPRHDGYRVYLPRRLVRGQGPPQKCSEDDEAFLERSTPRGGGYFKDKHSRGARGLDPLPSGPSERPQSGKKFVPSPADVRNRFAANG